MPGSNAHSEVVTDWSGLLEAAERNPEVKPSIEPEVQELTQILTEVNGFKARQEELKALRQEVTQKLDDTVKRGKEVAIRIRSVVRGKVGPRNERLVHFKVAPLRKRTRKAKTPNGETPATPAGATAPPSDKPVE